MIKKRPVLKTPTALKSPVTETKITNQTTLPPSDFSKIVAESKQALADAPPKKNKGGRPVGWRKEVAAPAAPILPVEITPSEMAPFLSDGHKAVFDSLAGALKRPQWELSKEKATDLGNSCDIMLQHWLPDLEKDPKKLALYGYLLALTMVGISILKEPRLAPRAAQLKKQKPEPSPQPKTELEDDPDDSGTVEHAPFTAASDNPLHYFPTQ